MVKETISRNEFSYSQGGVQLKFTLRIDSPDEMTNFKACMESAINDIDELLKGFKK